MVSFFHRNAQGNRIMYNSTYMYAGTGQPVRYTSPALTPCSHHLSGTKRARKVDLYVSTSSGDSPSTDILLEDFTAGFREYLGFPIRMAENVYLFVPNLIGYARVVLAIISFYYMPTNYVAAVWCYMISGLLDAFDGMAARALDQCSKLGTMLDMLTDRAATMCLLVTLSSFYPDYMFWFQMSMTIDIVSHWLHMQSALMSGTGSHKKIDLEGNPVLRHYYTNRNILFGMCAGNEMFYSMLYLCHFTYGPSILGLGLWQLLCVLSFPVALVKTMISVVQLVAASMNVVAIDVSDREKAAALKAQ